MRSWRCSESQGSRELFCGRSRRSPPLAPPLPKLSLDRRLPSEPTSHPSTPVPVLCRRSRLPSGLHGIWRCPIPSLPLLPPASSVFSTKARGASEKCRSAKAVPSFTTVKGPLEGALDFRTLVVATSSSPRQTSSPARPPALRFLHYILFPSPWPPRVLFPLLKTLLLLLCTGEITYLSSLSWAERLRPCKIRMLNPDAARWWC